MTKRIKFTTLNTTLNKLVANGTDRDSSREIVEIASIIKTYTKNVMIAVSHQIRGEVWFYMKNTNEDDRYNNSAAYKVLVNLINPYIKVGAFLWPDDITGTHINGVHYDVIDVNLFGTGSNGERDREDARRQAEVWFRESAERLKKE